MSGRTRARLVVAIGLGLGLAVLGPVWAVQARQAAELAVDGDAISFRHVGVEQGLDSEVVLSVTQDALGFVWIGTDEGLARFDGVEMTPYRRTADSTSVSGNVVQVLAPGQGGDVWVGTGTGAARYDAATDRFQRIQGLPSDDVLALEPDGEGGAWVGTAEGLAHVTASGAVDSVDRHDATDPGGLPHDIVESLLLTDGELWVGTGDGLARRRDGRFQTFRPDSLDLDRGLPVSSIAPSERGVLLVGTMNTGTGLLAFDPGSGRFTRIDLGSDVIGQNVTDVHEDGDGTVWVGTLGGGLRRLTPGAAQPTIYEADADDPNSLSGDDVSGLLEDRQGILWIATYSGLDRFDRARGTAARLRHDSDDATSISSNAVLSVLKASDGTLYVGTDRSLDRSTDGRAFTRTPISVRGDRDEHAVRTLYEDRDDTVWVGTVGAGLLRVEPNGRLAGVGFENGGGAGGLIVTALLDDRQRRFWIGTSTRGLALHDRESGRTVFLRHQPGRQSSLADNTVLSLAEDASGSVWVGTELGLCRLDGTGGGGRFTCLPVGDDDPSALSDGYVQALHARSDGMLWIGTKGGFYGLDTDDVAGGLQRYTTENSELPGDAVTAIVEDESGFLWLSTNGGLARFQPFTEEFYRRLGSEDAERTLNGAAARAPDGQLFFGSTRGLLAFFPGQLAALNANPPQAVITQVEVGGEVQVPGESDVLDRAAPVAERIDLDPDQSFLTIHYAGLHFSAPDANTYRYRMVGLYDEWNDAGTTREANFPSLPAGRYTFEVQAANADGVGFDDAGGGGRTASLAVVMHPPWWRTWWALLGFAALAVFGLVRADRWQRARLLRQERERADRREAELRAETAEAENRKATAEAAVLKAENDRKAAELERTRDVEAANARLEASLRDLRETQAQLVQSEKLASLGQLTAGIAHEIKNPLNFVNNFADLSAELTEELRDELAEAADQPTSRSLEAVGPLLDDLRDNCRRILEHGRRADGIVKSMLLHSRGGASDRGQVVINLFVEEYVNLAFHGARANDSDFQVEVVRDLDPDAGEVSLVPQEFGRVLINLLTNAFHAVVERSRVAGGGYQGQVAVRTRRDGDHVTIEVADNGTGIPDEVKAKIFEPFFTTKPAGQGTGLGLSLAHDIVTAMHGGRMWVESAPGEGTSFFVALPNTVEDA